MKKVFGIVLIVLALGITILPQYTSCQAQGKFLTLANGKTVPMKCEWTAKAELATGIPLIAVGIMAMTSKRRESFRNISIMGVVLGAFVIALPERLIGVCSSEMPCNLIMEPALLGMGALVVAGSAIGVVSTLRSKENEL